MLDHDVIHRILRGEGVNKPDLRSLHWKSQIIGICRVEGTLELDQGKASSAFEVWTPLLA